MSDAPSRSSLRIRRPPSRPDEVISLAQRAHTIVPEGSAPIVPEDMELDFTIPFAIPTVEPMVLPLSWEPHNSVGYNSDDSMPALDSHEDSSGDEEHGMAVITTRATQVPPVRGPQEVFLSDEPIEDIISRLQALRARPGGHSTGPHPPPHQALPPPFHQALPLPPFQHTLPSLQQALPLPPLQQALPAPPTSRTTLISSQNLSLIAAVVQGASGVGNTIVQTGLPLLQAVPTWGNLYDCVVHRNGEVAGAFRALASMDLMIIAVADIPLPIHTVIDFTTQPGFRRLGLHQAARSERLHPVPSSEHTRDLLAHHNQPLNTPVFVVFVYGEFTTLLPAAPTVAPTVALPPTVILPPTIVLPSTATANTNLSETIQAMMTLRLSADRDDLAQIASQPYGTAYLDILQVKHVLLICRNIGVRLHKPNRIALWHDLLITFRDLHHFLNLRSTFKNACTLYTHTVKAQARLQAQDTNHPGTMSVANALLLQCTNLVLDVVVIDPDPEDAAAQYASQVPRATLLGEVRRVL